MTSAPKSTASADSPRVATPAPVTGSARLVLFVTVPGRKKPNTTAYHLRRVPSHPHVGYPAFRLTKDGDTYYDLILTPHGWTCECKDFLFRRGNLPKGCKHTAAVQALAYDLGLLGKE